MKLCLSYELKDLIHGFHHEFFSIVVLSCPFGAGKGVPHFVGFLDFALNFCGAFGPSFFEHLFMGVAVFD